MSVLSRVPRHKGSIWIIIALTLLTIPIMYNIVNSYIYEDNLDMFYQFAKLNFKQGLVWSGGYWRPGWECFRPFSHGLVLWSLPRLFGREIWVVLIVFFLWHVLNAFILFIFTFYLTKKRICAVISSFLFLFHQAGTEPLIITSFSHPIIAVFFALLSLLFLLYYYDRHHWKWLLGSLLFFNMGLYTEESFVIVMLYVFLLTEMYYFKKVSLLRRAILYSIYFLSIIIYSMIRHLATNAPLVGTSYIRSPSFILRNMGIVLRNIILPYDSMCLPPYRSFFIVLFILIACTSVAAFFGFIYITRLRNKLFLFSLACLLSYVACVSNFLAVQRICYFAVPFYSLIIASLFTLSFKDSNKYYKFSCVTLSIVLLINNYSLLLLKTYDWLVIGRINKQVTQIFCDNFKGGEGRRVHAVGFSTVRLLYLRGMPILAPMPEHFIWSHWRCGKSDKPLDESDISVWPNYKELARAYKYGNGIKNSDFILALEKERINGRYKFNILFDTVEHELPKHLSNVNAPGSSFPIMVNFQLMHAFVPLDGFEIDEGKKYETWRGYGWDQELIGEDRNWDRWTVVDLDRKRVDQQLKDTFVHTRAGKATWDIDLKNGNYLVSIGWGDTMYPNPPQIVKIEGKIIASTTNNTRAGEFVEINDVPIKVDDGKLTMELIPQRKDSTVIMNYLIIKSEDAMAKHAD
jgi:hypothetical protein